MKSGGVRVLDPRRRWRDILYLGAGAFLIAILLLRADVTDTIDSISSIDLWTIGFVLVLYFFNLFCKVARWYSLVLGMGGRNVNSSMVPIYVSALAINNSTPAKIGGEPIRALMLKEHTGNGISLGIATIFIEKSLDTIVVFLMACIGFVYLAFLLGFDDVSAIVYPLAVVGIATAAVLALAAHPGSVKVIGKVIGRAPKGPPWSRKLMDKGLEVLVKFHRSFAILRRKPRTVVGIILLSVAIWLNEALRLFLIINAIDGGPEISFGGAVSAMAIANILGFILPLGSGIVLGASSVIEVISGKGAAAAAAGASIVQVITSIWIAIPLGLISLAYLRRSSKRARRGHDGAEVLT